MLHTWIILSLKVSWWMAFPSAFVLMEIKLTWWTCFKNSNNRINTSAWEICPLKFTCKSTVLSSDELDSSTFETWTLNLSFDDDDRVALVPSVVDSLAGKSDVSSWFLLACLSISANKELNVSFAVIRMEALSFWQNHDLIQAIIWNN